MGIRSSIGTAVAQKILARSVRELTERALDALDAARPQDLAALERDLSTMAAQPARLEARVSDLEQALAKLERTTDALVPPSAP